MKANLTIDKKFIRLYELTDYELKQLKISFTKKINNWFIIKKKIHLLMLMNLLSTNII